MAVMRDRRGNSHSALIPKARHKRIGHRPGAPVPFDQRNLTNVFIGFHQPVDHRQIGVQRFCRGLILHNTNNFCSYCLRLFRRGDFKIGLCQNLTEVHGIFRRFRPLIMRTICGQLTVFGNLVATGIDHFDR